MFNNVQQKENQVSLYKNYVAGQWCEGDEQQSLGVFDPANEKLVAHCAIAGHASIEKALLGARACFDNVLSVQTPESRADLMRKIAKEIRLLADTAAQVLCLESGKTINDAKDEFLESARYFDYYGGLADKIEGKSIPLGGDYIDYTVYEPFGVCAQVIPWNFPVSLCARSLAPAMAAGNAVVIKSPELDPLAITFIAIAFERAGAPRGVLSILNGYGATTGAQLVSHQQVDHIVFTGSVATGQSILHAASENVVPAVMELGGKSAAIMMPDVDLELLLKSVKVGIFFNAGQVCSAMSRLFIHRSRYSEVREALVNLATSLTIEHGLENPDLTPLISQQQLKKVIQACNKAKENGAHLLCGGHQVDRPGHFMAATIIDNIDPSDEIAQQEIFGPVLCIMPFDDLDEAIEKANNTPFGLCAGIFTHHINHIHQATKKLKAGQVFVNQWYAGGISTPFGGVAKSGYGREKGVEALYNYVRTKNIAIYSPL